MDHQNEAIALAVRLMEANRTLYMSKHMLDQFRQISPDIPDAFWDQIDPEGFVDLMIPIYTKHLTTEDMRAAIEFYESSAGKRILDKTPAMMEESMRAGEQWGIELAERWEKKHNDEKNYFETHIRNPSN